jgi:hypothetical protein
MKQNSRRNLAPALAILLFIATFTGFSQVPNSWKVVGPGGGGTTIGPTVSPHDPRLVVEHCDMTGGYITRDNGESWRMFNLRGGITVLAFDPSDPQVIYAGNAGLWRSGDTGRTWKMLFPNPARNTIEHQIGDHSDYALTSSDPAYPGGVVSAIAIAPPSGPHGPERLYLSFEQKGRPAVIVSSLDGGVSWSRLATLPQRVLLLTPHESGLIAISGSAAYRIGPNGSTTELGGIPAGVRAASAARSGGAVWIYATSRDGKVYLSEDSGLRWRPVTPALQQTSGSFEAIYKFLNLLENSPYELDFLSMDMHKMAPDVVVKGAQNLKWEAVFKIKLLTFVQ